MKKITLIFTLVYLFYLAIKPSTTFKTTTKKTTTKKTTSPPNYLFKGNLIRSFNYTSKTFYDQLSFVLPDGNIACSGDSYINIWNTNGNLIRTLNNHLSYPYHVTSMVVLKNGFLASGSSDASIKIWNYTKGELIKSLSSSYYGVFGLAVLPQGYLASTSPDSNAYPYFKLSIWDVNSYSIIQNLEGHSIYASSLDVLKDGRLVSSALDGIKIWNTSTRILTNYFLKDQKVGFVKVLKNGNLAATTSNFTVTIINPLNGSIIRILRGHKGNVRRICELNNGYLASASEDKTVKIWNITTGLVIKTLNKHNNFVSSVAVLKNGYLVSSSIDSEINIWG